MYREILEHFYDSRETSSFNLIGQVSGVVVNKIKPNSFQKPIVILKITTANMG